MKNFLISFIKFYQRNISVNLPPRCRFQPTCSEYAIESLRINGSFWGILQISWRILRCQPLCKGGYDPVRPFPLWKHKLRSKGKTHLMKDK